MRRKAEGDQPQTRVTDTHTAASRHAQRPVRSASAVWTCGREQHIVKDPGNHRPAPRALASRRSVEPPRLLQLPPRPRIAIEAKTA
ncbi:hypothetical protein ACWDZ6_20380 [Streptomyces sp. NPDC002926]